MKTKKFLATSLAAIMSISSLLASVPGTVSAAKYGYRQTSDYTLEDDTASLAGIWTGPVNAIPGELNQRAYIRTNNSDGSVHYKVIATTKDAKIRLYYDERYNKYYLASTSTTVMCYEYDSSVNQHFKKTNQNKIEFKPQSGVTVGGQRDCVYLNGDVNFDHQINVTDISIIAAHIKGKKVLKGSALQFANVCNETNPTWGGPDDTINVSDLSLISAYVKGKNVRL